MQQRNQPKLCQTHKQECIGIEIHPKSQFRHCCQQCLDCSSKPIEYVIYSHAYSELTTKKNRFCNKVEQQSKKNSIILQNFMIEIEKLRKRTIEDLDALGANIKQQISETESFVLQSLQNLQAIDIDTYLHKNIVFNQKPKYEQFIISMNDKLSNIFIKSNLNQLVGICSSLELDAIELEKLNYKGQPDHTLNFLCPKHTNAIRLFDLNKSTKAKGRLLCEECMDDFSENNLRPITSIQSVQKQWQNYVNWNLEKIEKFQQITSQMNSVFKILSEFNNYLQKEIITTKSNVENLRNNISNKYEKQTNDLLKSWNLLSEQETMERTEILSSCKTWVKQMEKVYESQYKTLEDQINDAFFHSILQIQNQYHACTSTMKAMIGYENQSKDIQTISYPKANYEQITTLKQKEQLLALAINKSQDVIVCGFYYKIGIFQFVNEKLEPKMQLSTSYGDITAICFCQDDQFVTATSGSQLKLWNMKNQKDAIKPITVDEETREAIRFLLWDSKHNLIIVSLETFIVFRNTSLKMQFILDMNSSIIQNLYLNDQQNKLIICNNSGFNQIYGNIKIAEYDGKQFVEKQIISLNGKVRSVGVFENEQFFCVQEKEGNSLQIYKQGKHKYHIIQSLILGNELEEDSNIYFSQFNKTKQKYICKHNTEICIINKTQDDVFFVEQKLNFETLYVKLLFFQEGEHFITWDNKSKEIKLWKQK